MESVDPLDWAIPRMSVGYWLREAVRIIENDDRTDRRLEVAVRMAQLEYLSALIEVQPEGHIGRDVGSESDA
jgi:hypothetical protein